MYSWAKVTTECVRGPWGNRLLCLSVAHVPVTINACWTTMAFPSAWHSLVLSLPSAAVTGVLKAVISTLCSIATVPSPLLYCSQFSQACGCLSLEVDSPVICFSCLPSCCSAPTFLLHRDISLSITAFNNAVFHMAPHAHHFHGMWWPIVKRSEKQNCSLQEFIPAKLRNACFPAKSK